MAQPSYKAGVFTTPSSPGDVTVTLPAEPDGIVFFGCNFTELDTLRDSSVDSFRSAAYMGIAGRTLEDGSIDQFVNCAKPDGDAFRMSRKAVLALVGDGSDTTLFAGSVTAMGGTGFTVTFSTAAAGYSVYWLAWWGSANAGMFDVWSTTGDTAVGWQPRTMLTVGASSISDDTGEASYFNLTTATYGAASYPNPAWSSANVSTHRFLDAVAHAGLNEIENGSGAAPVIGWGGHFSGPFLISNPISGYPSGTGLTDFHLEHEIGAYNMFLLSDDRSQCAAPGIPAEVDDTETTTFSFLAGVEAVLFFSMSQLLGETNTVAGGDIGGGFGVSVATEDFQASVHVHAGEAYASYGYQSQSLGFISKLTPSTSPFAGTGDGVHGGTVEISGNTITLTDTLADADDAGTLVCCAFEGANFIPWIPHIYRRGAA